MIPTVLLLFIALCTVFLLFSNRGDSPIDFSLKGFFREMMANGKLKLENRTLLKRIGALEKRRDEDAFDEILEIGLKGGTPYKARMKAFQALGRIGNHEDVNLLVERSLWYQGSDALYMAWVAETIGEIGGDEACRALEYKLFEGAQNVKYSSVSGFALDTVVSGIKQANCLTIEEIHEQLWIYGRDMWAGMWVQEESMDILAGEGNEEAIRLLEEYRVVLNSYKERGYANYSLDGFNMSLLDGSLPWHIKSRIADGLRYKGSAPKEEILNLYLQMMRDWYSDDASVRFKIRDDWLMELGKGIVRSRKSSWQGQPKQYFDGYEDKIKRSQEGSSRDRMLHLVEHLHTEG